MAQGFYGNMNYESTKPILKFPGNIFYEAIRAHENGVKPAENYCIILKTLKKRRSMGMSYINCCRRAARAGKGRVE